MPIGVPLIICGSIALVGSGYALKKLVYDPHLAHYIEAFIANHRSRPVQTDDIPVPIAVHSTGTTTARAKVFGGLRRRGRPPQNRNEEDGEPLISLESREPQQVSIVRETAYLDDDTPPSYIARDSEPSRRADGFKDNSAAHDDEIKSIIFNVPPSPAPATASGTSRLNPPASDNNSGLLNVSPGQPSGPSATFSFLSLSQVSSPEGPSAMLDSMSFSHIATSQGWSEASFNDREVISMAETSGSQTDGFSNVSSPRNGNADLGWRSPTMSNAGTGPSGVSGGGGLGLSAVEDVGMSYILSPRRQASVISLSESENGEGAGSDWEAISARSA